MSAADPSAPLARLYEGTLDCVHCGLCLSACPTYRETGRESSSPRGRIHLFRGVAEGRVPLGEAVADESFLCLACRACETACPSGVRFGRLVEMARGEVERAGLRSGPQARLERLALRQLVARPRRLHHLFSALGLVQRIGLDRLLRRLLPAGLRGRLDLLPPVPMREERAPLPELTPAAGAHRGRVALFRGCVMSELFAPVHAATVRVLARNGFDVLVPPAQGCCGALHAHAGDEAFAHGLARANLVAFDFAEVDALVVNSAGCGAALREYGLWLPGAGEPLAEQAIDVSAFLADVGLTAPLAPLALRVCYDDPCHLIHAQGVADAPRRLLASIPELELVPHDDPGACCGAAGTYNVTHPEMSRAILARKMESLAAADPDVIATGNPGCLMQLRAGALEHDLRAEVLHPVQLLDRAV